MLTLFTPLITTPYLSRVLGVDGIGTYSFTTSIVSYFVLLATLGVSTYAQREVAYHQDDMRATSRIFYEVMLLKVILVIVSMLLYYLMIMTWQPESERLIYWIQALNIFAVLFDISWFFQGLEEFGKIVFRNLVIRVLNIVMIFLCIKSSEDLLLYIGLLAVMGILATGLLFQYMPCYLVRVPWQTIKPWRNFRVMIELFLPNMAIQVYTVLDKTMLGMMVGSPAENGYYEQAEKIVKISLTVVTSLGTVMLPRIAFAYARGQMEDIRKYMLLSFRFVWAISLFSMAVIVGIAANFVPWFLGPDFGPVVALLQMFTILLPVIGISNVIGIQYLLTTNRQNLLTASVTSGAIVNFLLNLYMIPHFSSMGATIASILAEIAVTAVQMYFVRKVFPPEVILRLGLPYLGYGAVIMGGLLYLGDLLSPSILHTFLLIMLGSGLYLVVLAWRHDSLLEIVREKLARKSKFFL